MRIAAIQLCSSHNIQENLIFAGSLIKKAAHDGAKLVVLPEMFAIMGEKDADKLAAKETPGHGIIQAFLEEQSRDNKLWIVGGTIPIACNNPSKIRATCLVYNNKGEVVARYDKIHLFDVILSQDETYQESDTTEPGDLNQLSVINTPFGKLGVAVCYDIRFPELFRALANKGAEIIAIPAAFTVKTGEAHWELLCRARAVENFCYVIGACQGGKHSNNKKTYGHSMIIEPWGNIIAKKNDDTPGIIYADIDLEHLKQIRNAIPALQHQRMSF